MCCGPQDLVAPPQWEWGARQSGEGVEPPGAPGPASSAPLWSRPRATDPPPALAPSACPLEEPVSDLLCKGECCAGPREEGLRTHKTSQVLRLAGRTRGSERQSLRPPSQIQACLPAQPEGLEQQDNGWQDLVRMEGSEANITSFLLKTVSGTPLGSPQSLWQELLPGHWGSVLPETHLSLTSGKGGFGH